MHKINKLYQSFASGPRLAALGLCTAALIGCGSSSDPEPTIPLNELPVSIQGEILRQSYDGIGNDLLTAGLGADGLGSATAPAFADDMNPTVDELRKRVIHANYRALVPTAPGGGYGEFFGPQVNADNEQGLIAGEEWIAFSDAEDGARVTVMVQVPASFSTDHACMVTAPSSGSRGIYGAIGTAGEWGLKRGCAVVYTDKGTGTGAHNLAGNTTQRIDGVLVEADDPAVLFRAALSEAERLAYNDDFPSRFAFKHAHSQRNPEQDWGSNVLESIRFGFYAINELYGDTDDQDRRLRTLTPDNTLVIASSVSNGGGASVLAAELDSEGLIDGVAVSEPNVNPVVDRSFAIQQGDAEPITEHSRSLLDYTTALAVYQGCANRAPSIRDAAPFNAVFNNPAINENTCMALAAKGLVVGATVDEQAEDALRILNQTFAIPVEQNLVQPANYGINVPQSISVTYANAYGRISVIDNLCEFSFAATSDGLLIALTAVAERALFATSNGIPPTGGVDVVYNAATGGPTVMRTAVSPSSGLQDHALDGFLCLRALVTGIDPVTGAELSGEALALSERVRQGIEAVRASGDLRGKPAVFVTPRNDQILPTNHTSRPYYGLNQRVEGEASRLHYYEVLNAQHLDLLNDFPGFNEQFIPLHHYLFEALDLMYDHLRNATPLPPSQVVRTVPRGAGAPPLTADNLPPIAVQPDIANLIRFENDRLGIPD